MENYKLIELSDKKKYFLCGTYKVDGIEYLYLSDITNPLNFIIGTYENNKIKKVKNDEIIFKVLNEVVKENLNE